MAKEIKITLTDETFEALRNLTGAQVALFARALLDVAEAAEKDETWDFAIENGDSVPVEYRLVDRARIRARVEACGDDHGIPGVFAWRNS